MKKSNTATVVVCHDQGLALYVRGNLVYHTTSYDTNCVNQVELYTINEVDFFPNYLHELQEKSKSFFTIQRLMRRQPSPWWEDCTFNVGDTFASAEQELARVRRSFPEETYRLIGNVYED